MKIKKLSTLNPMIVPQVIPLTSFFPVGFQKDALPDAPVSDPVEGVLGLADADFSNLKGTTTSGAVISQFAEALLVLPSNYIEGAPITLRVRAKVSANQATSQKLTMAAYSKLDVSGTYIQLGSNGAGTAITTSFANYDLTLNPVAHLQPGMEIIVEVGTILEGEEGYGEICHVELRNTVWG